MSLEDVFYLSQSIASVAVVGFRAAWKVLSSQFGKDFREFVDAQVATTPVAASVNLFEEWQKAVQVIRPKQNG